jgi:hypothetical protein
MRGMRMEEHVVAIRMGGSPLRMCGNPLRMGGNPLRWSLRWWAADMSNSQEVISPRP